MSEDTVFESIDERVFTAAEVGKIPSEELNRMLKEGTFETVPQMDGSLLYAYIGRKMTVKIPEPDRIIEVENGEPVADGIMRHVTFGYKDGSRGRVTMLFGNVTLDCSCAPFKMMSRCPHMGMAISEGVDGPLMNGWLHGTLHDAAEMSLWSVPLFDLTDSEGMFYVLCKLSRKQMHGRSYGQLSVMTGSESPAVALEGAWKAEGNTYHNVGMVTEYDGRETMRAQIAAWVTTQELILDSNRTIIECQSYYHTGPVLPVDTLNKSAIILTGECLTCYAKTDKTAKDFSSDVPDF